MLSADRWAIDLAERGAVPAVVVRAGVRRLLRDRLAAERRRIEPDRRAALDAHLARMRAGPIASVPLEANRQHYEVPAGFFELVLGARLKYSCACWPAGVASLDAAEDAMLALTCERAEIADGMRILDLGCGWGSLALWVAERYPAASVLAVSNSESQRAFVEARRRERRLANLRVTVSDANAFEPSERFDRVVSIEMFEHMCNYERLLERIASWLTPAGKLFVHVFCHRSLFYFFEADGRADWMARHFFTGGMMPSADLLPCFQRHLRLEDRWEVDGRHYAKTARAWLENLNRHHDRVRRIFEDVPSHEPAGRLIRRWRLFFTACAELFGYGDGSEWFVTHYRFGPPGGAARLPN